MMDVGTRVGISLTNIKRLKHKNIQCHKIKTHKDYNFIECLLICLQPLKISE